MDGKDLFIIQLVGVIASGGFIGEFYRSISSGTEINLKLFLANYLASSFIAMLITYSFYIVSNNKAFSIVLGGLLAYQDERWLSRFSRKLLKDFLRGEDKDK